MARKSAVGSVTQLELENKKRISKIRKSIAAFLYGLMEFLEQNAEWLVAMSMSYLAVTGIVWAVQNSPLKFGTWLKVWIAGTFKIIIGLVIFLAVLIGIIFAWAWCWEKLKDWARVNKHKDEE